MGSAWRKPIGLGRRGIVREGFDGLREGKHHAIVDDSSPRIGDQDEDVLHH